MMHSYIKKTKSTKDGIEYVKYTLSNGKTSVKVQVEKDKNNKDIDHFRKNNASN